MTQKSLFTVLTMQKASHTPSSNLQITGIRILLLILFVAILLFISMAPLSRWYNGNGYAGMWSGPYWPMGMMM